jgi:hypothetical protein
MRPSSRSLRIVFGFLPAPVLGLLSLALQLGRMGHE